MFDSFRLSHVPPERFASFRALVDRCLASDRGAIVVDSAHPSVMQHAPGSRFAAHRRHR